MADIVKNSAAPGTPQTAAKSKYAAAAAFVTPFVIAFAAKYLGPDYVAQFITTDSVAMAIGFIFGAPTAISAGFAAYKARNKPKAA